VPTAPVSGRADLSEAQWAVPEPLLPVGEEARPAAHERRDLIDGIRWRTRAGCRGGMRPSGMGRGSVRRCAVGRARFTGQALVAGPAQRRLKALLRTPAVAVARYGRCAGLRSFLFLCTGRRQARVVKPPGDASPPRSVK